MAFNMDYPLTVSCHGGSCCGMSHLHEFPGGANSTIAERVAYIKAGIEEVVDENIPEVDEDDHPGVNDDNFRHCVQVVITAGQRQNWDEPLIEAGFTEVFSFVNSKSGNRCHVYLMETNRPDDES